MGRVCLKALLLLVTAGTLPAWGGGGPENAVVVVNGASPDSVALASAYVRLRGIPAGSVVTLDNVPGTPVIDVKQFRELILGPVLQALDTRGLRRQVDYVIYSCGFPYGVNLSADMAGRQFPRVLTQPASLTGLTYLYEQAMSGDPGYLSLDANWYYRPLKQQGPTLSLDERERGLQVRLQQLLEQSEKARRAAREAKTPPPAAMTQWLDEAVRILQSLVASHKAPELLYDLACVLALQGQPEQAMATLHSAFETGWWNAWLTASDSDLASLRERDDFKALLAKMRQTVVETEPPLPFRSEIRWPLPGAPAGASIGRRYLISAMLGYVGGPANTLPEALECLKRARAADGTCPAGTVYYMESTDWARTGPRQWAFRSAAEALGKLGVRAEVLPGVLPKDKADVAGAMVGIATFDWKESGSQVLPGAFCDHLTSCGGIMTGGGQTLLSEFLRHGAAGACGTVTEPYNTPAKFPSPFLHVFYASGCTLGEAFYQSLRGPYQQLLVGDPLCQPWARAPEVQVKGLQARERIPTARWLQPTAVGASEFELYVDGIRRHTCRAGGRLRLEVEGLASGEHEARVVCLSGPLETRGRATFAFHTP